MFYERLQTDLPFPHYIVRSEILDTLRYCLGERCLCYFQFFAPQLRGRTENDFILRTGLIR